LTVEETGFGSSELPLVKGKVRLDGRPTAYVCQRRACSPPVTDVHQLEEML
jgi:uncharacterized protein YyaL (SSP411 family)